MSVLSNIQEWLKGNKASSTENRDNFLSQIAAYNSIESGGMEYTLHELLTSLRLQNKLLKCLVEKDAGLTEDFHRWNHDYLLKLQLFVELVTEQLYDTPEVISVNHTMKIRNSVIFLIKCKSPNYDELFKNLSCAYYGWYKVYVKFADDNDGVEIEFDLKADKYL